MQLTDNLGRQVTPNAQAISVRAAGRCFFYGESNGESWLQATDPSGTWSRPVARGVSGLLGLGGPAVDYDTIAPSPDGTRVAFRGVDGIINVCNREGLGLRVFNSGSGDHRDLKWSPDGSRLAYTEDSGNSPKVWLASADGSCAHQLVDGSQARWAPDGKSLSVVMQDPAGTVLKVVKLDPSGNATGEPVLISGTGPIHNFGWVGERAFYSQSSPGQPLAYLQSGGPSVKTENWNVSASEAACSATQVAFVDGKSENLYCLTPESKSVALIREDKCSHPCWSPSGSQLVFNCRVGYSLGICRIDADGRNFLTISHGSKDQVYPHWVK
jgi:WD40 repeat protein